MPLFQSKQAKKAEAQQKAENERFTASPETMEDYEGGTSKKNYDKDFTDYLKRKSKKTEYDENFYKRFDESQQNNIKDHLAVIDDLESSLSNVIEEIKKSDAEKLPQYEVQLQDLILSMSDAHRKSMVEGQPWSKQKFSQDDISTFTQYMHKTYNNRANKEEIEKDPNAKPVVWGNSVDTKDKNYLHMSDEKIPSSSFSLREISKDCFEDVKKPPVVEGFDLPMKKGEDEGVDSPYLKIKWTEYNEKDKDIQRKSAAIAYVPKGKVKSSKDKLPAEAKESSDSLAEFNSRRQLNKPERLIDVISGTSEYFNKYPIYDPKKSDSKSFVNEVTSLVGLKQLKNPENQWANEEKEKEKDQLQQEPDKAKKSFFGKIIDFFKPKKLEKNPVQSKPNFEEAHKPEASTTPTTEVSNQGEKTKEKQADKPGVSRTELSLLASMSYSNNLQRDVEKTDFTSECSKKSIINEKTEAALGLLKGWKNIDNIVNVSNDSTGGFSAGVFAKGSNIVIAFRGTDGGAGEDTSWAFGKDQQQADYAVSYVMSLFDDGLIQKDDNVYLTGHSLGGFLTMHTLASLLDKPVFAKSFQKAATFNGLGLNSLRKHNIPLIKTLKKAEEANQLERYAVEGDIIAPLGHQLNKGATHMIKYTENKYNKEKKKSKRHFLHNYIQSIGHRHSMSNTIDPEQLKAELEAKKNEEVNTPENSQAD